MKKIVSILLALLLIGALALPAGAVQYPDSFPNTHRNTGRQLADLIAVAKTQIGYTELNTATGQPLTPQQNGGYTKYGAWFGASTTPWCAFFIVWCANQAGIPGSVIPRIGSCAALAQRFQAAGRYIKPGTLAPRTGDLVFYNWAGGATPKHIGLVTGVSKSEIYTVEGNTGSTHGYRVEAKTRKRSAGYIIGYARPGYNDAATYVGSYSFAAYAAAKYKFAAASGSVRQGTQTKKSRLAVITASATDVSAASAVLNGSVENASGYPVRAAGFYFGTEKSNMKPYTLRTNVRSAKTALTCEIARLYGALKMKQTYYYCTFAEVNKKTYRGPVYSVTTVDDRPKLLVLSDEAITMEPGETFELFSALLPQEARSDGILWQSSDETVAAVQDGVITANSVGSVCITAKSVYGSASAQCRVTVTLPAVADADTENCSGCAIRIFWQPQALPACAGYEIYKSELPDEGYSLAASLGADASEWTDTRTAAGQTWYYKLRRIGTSAEYHSAFGKPLRERALPAVPEQASARQKQNGVLLQWNGDAGIALWHIYRSRSPQGGYSLLGTSADTQFYDQTIRFGETYYYRISADTGAAQSRLSAPSAVATVPYRAAAEDFIMQDLLKPEAQLKPLPEALPMLDFVDAGQHAILP